MICKLCDKPLVSEDINEKLCSNSKLHEGKLKIAELLRKLTICTISENRDVISQIKSLENQYQVPDIERYDFASEKVKIKFELQGGDF